MTELALANGVTLPHSQERFRENVFRLVLNTSWKICVFGSCMLSRLANEEELPYFRTVKD